MQRTFAIIKPDAVTSGHQGGILSKIQEAGLRVVALKTVRLSQTQAEGFYAVHKARPFFGELVEFMMRSPVFVVVLEREDAVAKYRQVMGATDPAKADEGTIRKAHGGSVGENAVHGSDSADNAKIEIAYFFAASKVAPVAG